eukprot:5252262-Pyramimonas_sp.AAC.1
MHFGSLLHTLTSFGGGITSGLRVGGILPAPHRPPDVAAAMESTNLRHAQWNPRRPPPVLRSRTLRLLCR